MIRVKACSVEGSTGEDKGKLVKSKLGSLDIGALTGCTITV